MPNSFLFDIFISFAHALQKLVVIDLAVLVFVWKVYQLVDHLLWNVLHAWFFQDLFELLMGNLSTVVFIKFLEDELEIRFILGKGSLQAARNKLIVVNLSIFISVNNLQYFFQLG